MILILMKNIIILFFTMLSLDYIYFNILGRKLISVIEKIQKDKFALNFYAALICYLVMSIGINYFIVQQNKSVKDAFLLGLLIYSVFEITSYAIFKKWPLQIVIIDSIWGGVLFAVSLIVLKYIQNKI